MKNTYIPFHFNKQTHMTIYYNYVGDYFFKSGGGKQRPFVAILSGTLGVIIYSQFKDKLMNVGNYSPLTVVAFSLIIGLIVGTSFLWGAEYLTKKKWDEFEVIPTPSGDDLAIYVKEGEEWLKSNIFLTLFLFIFTLMNTIFLFFMHDNVLLLVSHTFFWALLIVLIRGLKFFKRRFFYKQFKKELQT